MKNELDISTMSKSMIQSELNALNYIDRMTLKDRHYRNKLKAELNKRIEDECKAAEAK